MGTAIDSIGCFRDAAECQLNKAGRDSRPFIMGLNALTVNVALTISSFTASAALVFANY